MLDNINNSITNQDNLNSYNNIPQKISFKGNPNGVDNTPSADTYQTQQPQQDSMLRTVGYVIPTWYGLNKGADLFNKGCGGTYEKSIMGRLGKFGDYLSGTKLFNNALTKKISSGWSSFKVSAQAFIDKHPMLSAMQKTPTKPENSMPKSFMESQGEADIKEAFSELEKFVDKSPKSLKEAGATKDEINALKQKYGTNIWGKIKNKKLAIQDFQLRKLGGDAFADRVLAMSADDRVVELRKLKLDKLGLGNGIFEAIKSEPVAHAGTIEQALERGSVASSRLTRNLNKLKAMHLPTTKLGKLLPKLSKLGMRGLTFGGGLLNTLFVAIPLASSIKNTVDAPKEKKSGTLAEGIVDALSWVVSMPLALLGMHGVNGIKNTGISKDTYNLFRDEQKLFNLKAKNGGFASLAEWTAEKARIEGLKTVTAPQSKFTKAMVKVAKFLSIGLEQFTPFKESTAGLTGSAKRSAIMGNIKRAMPNFLKNCVGYPLRFGLYLLAFAPVVDKLMSWGTKAIFGEAYDPEKIKEEQAKEAERLRQLYSGPKLVSSPDAGKDLGKTDLNTLSNNNLLKQKILGVKPDSNNTNGANEGFNAAPVTMVSGEPFMPPPIPQQNGQTQNGVNNQFGENDPNKNTVDTVKRNYIPNLDVNAPLPYNDPMNDPNRRQNYQRSAEIMNKANQTMADLDKFIANGYRD